MDLYGDDKQGITGQGDEELLIPSLPLPQFPEHDPFPDRFEYELGNLVPDSISIGQEDADLSRGASFQQQRAIIIHQNVYDNNLYGTGGIRELAIAMRDELDRLAEVGQ